MRKDQLIQEFVVTHEYAIKIAQEAEQRGITAGDNQWGPRETIAHMAGWEVLSTVSLPRIVAGMAPLEQPDEERQNVMNDAINAVIVTMVGDQPLDRISEMLRQAYQQNIKLLKSLDETFFQPGQYMYERMIEAIEHCQGHIDAINALS